MLIFNKSRGKYKGSYLFDIFQCVIFFENALNLGLYLCSRRLAAMF